MENELKMVSYHLTKGEQLEAVLNSTFKQLEDITDVHEMTNTQLKRMIQKIEVDKDGNVVLSAAQQLAEVAVESARTASFFGMDPKVAVLSFSTYGSGKGGTVKLSHDAVEEARKMDENLVIDGEFQFDAAVSEEVARVKCPDSKVAGQANTFIFPLLEAGNIGYKIAQRLGGFAAYGPILQGLNAPINDLSRGCNADEVYYMAIITAGMA